jgi:hypothetical protein
MTTVVLPENNEAKKLINDRNYKQLSDIVLNRQFSPMQYEQLLDYLKEDREKNIQATFSEKVGRNTVYFQTKLMIKYYEGRRNFEDLTNFLGFG